MLNCQSLHLSHDCIDLLKVKSDFSSFQKTIKLYDIHKRFQGRELTRALMVTAEGSAERCIAAIHIPREARKKISHHGHLDELS